MNNKINKDGELEIIFVTVTKVFLNGFCYAKYENKKCCFIWPTYAKRKHRLANVIKGEILKVQIINRNDPNLFLVVPIF